MKKLSQSALAIFISLAMSAQAQTKSESLGLSGDNFDLYGALDLFKDSRNAEAFERTLNSQDGKINNLDLNADGKVDYIKVVDRSTGDTKILILQDVIGENESQDVAVIEMEKRGNEMANLQIVGDEALYGKDYIIYPQEEQQNTRYENEVRRTTVYVNVWSWPGVNWVYAPSYSPWVSPYYWSAYPVWWSPWSPFGWDAYYPRVYGYHHPYYHRANVYCLPHAHREYYGHRTSSVTVINRNKEVYGRDIPTRNTKSDGRGRNENQGKPNRNVRNGNNQVQPNRGDAKPQRDNAQPRGKVQNPNDDSRGGTGKPNKGAVKGGKQNQPSNQKQASPRGGSGRQEQPMHQNQGGSRNGNGGQGNHSGGNNSGGKRGR